MQDIMGANDIAFPNLGLYLKNVPQGFTVFGFYISLYGVIIAIGVMAGISIVAHLAKKTGQDPDDYWDFAIYGVIFGLVKPGSTMWSLTGTAIRTICWKSSMYETAAWPSTAV